MRNQGNRGQTRKDSGRWTVDGGSCVVGGEYQVACGRGPVEFPACHLLSTTYYLPPTTHHLPPTVRRLHPPAVPLCTLCVTWLPTKVLLQDAPRFSPESWWFRPESFQFRTRKFALLDQKVGSSQQKSTSFPRFCQTFKELEKCGPKKVFSCRAAPSTHYSALGTQHSALSTQHSVLACRPADLTLAPAFSIRVFRLALLNRSRETGVRGILDFRFWILDLTAAAKAASLT